MTLPPNVAAFLGCIRVLEGTSAPDGYRALYGWRPGLADRLFVDTSVHPQRRFWIHTGREVQPGESFGPTDTTTAAGAYQITWPTWSSYQRWCAAQGMPRAAFDQAGQDACAIWLIQRAGAYADVAAGRFQVALVKCSPTWASLPYSTAQQNPKDYDAAELAYRNCGGTLA